MKLKSQIFITTNSKGSKINVEGRDVAIFLNGEKLPNKLFDIIKHLEFDTGEIYGNSLLSYYVPQQDGSLAVEGSIVQLMDAKTNESILIKGFERPGVHDDGTISFEHVKQFAEFFKIAKPEEVFKDLSADEKQIFISEREAKMQAIRSSEAANQSQKDAEELQARKAAEAALKASIEPEYVMEKSSYHTTQGFYNEIGFKETIDGPYHLFYGSNTKHDPCILIKRGDAWWEEINPETLETLDKTDAMLIIGFKDGETPKKATLELETLKLTVTDNN